MEAGSGSVFERVGVSRDAPLHGDLFAVVAVRGRCG